MKRVLFIFIALQFLTFSFADKKGEEIARRNFDLKRSKDSSSITIMILISKNGDKTVRKMESYSKDGKDGENSFIYFIEPANVKRTTFLTFGHKKGDDEQRLFLPAFGKIRKISSSNKGQKFMGSDLFYYDMEDHDFEDFTYQFIREEKYDGKDCNVVAMYPKAGNAPYSKQLAWISKTDDFTYKLECYDKNNEKNKTKTIVFKDIVKKQGVLIPTKILIDNHIDVHKTVMMETELKVNTGLKDDIFTIQNMQK